jgi:hypothetical protein
VNGERRASGRGSFPELADRCEPSSVHWRYVAREHAASPKVYRVAARYSGAAVHGSSVAT